MKHRRGRALRRRYGRTNKPLVNRPSRFGRASSHPLFPRLVMYREKVSPTDLRIYGKLQKHYGGAWTTVVDQTFPSVREGRQQYHTLADSAAAWHGVPADHIEYA